VEHDPTLWIVTSYKIPGAREARASLAAKIQIRDVYKGNDLRLSAELKRYVVDWSKSREAKKGRTVDRSEPGKAKVPALCTVVEAQPDGSRFFPVNDMTCCLHDLRYVNKDGRSTRYSPRRVMRVDPECAHVLERHAATVAKRTVFISYKCGDFDARNGIDLPPWCPEQLAGLLISRGRFGVWLDTLCTPSQPEESSDSLTRRDVQLLLAEGHVQSRVLVAIDTAGYRTPGTAGVNWTGNEYSANGFETGRAAPLARFVLSADGRFAGKPPPELTAPWSDDICAAIIPRLSGLLERGERATGPIAR
jgi:hypothetical protein